MGFLASLSAIPNFTNVNKNIIVIEAIDPLDDESLRFRFDLEMLPEALTRLRCRN
jgi:hypothetical protein|tara:strand:- start:177 stop:341 length:165 start_codon:yes stop_codon:yes gene_type:complete